MTIRPAQMADAPDICKLINYYAERGRMLHRSLEGVYNNLRDFQVALDEQGKVVGCVAIETIWAGLAEIKSLAVASDLQGAGIGSQLVEAAIKDARRLGVTSLFALTYERKFFEKNGFQIVDRQSLPEKVWRECISCPKANACDEIAMMMQLKP